MFVAAQDFTVVGGTLGEMHATRIAHAQRLALESGVPFIQINDSGGARIQEGVLSLDGYAKIFRANTLSSGVIPQFSIILGPCAGRRGSTRRRSRTSSSWSTRSATCTSPARRSSGR